MKPIPIIFLLPILLFFFYCSADRQHENKINTHYFDLPADTLFPASSRELSISSDSSTIYGLLYLASGSGPHPTVIFLNGFPGFERNMDIAQVLRRKGWNTVSFNYRGSWGSEGTFSYQNCIDDIEAVIKDLQRDEDYDLGGRIDNSRYVLLGNSFGGGVAMNYLKNSSSNITEVILLSSFNIGGFADYVENSNQIEGYKNFLSQKKQLNFNQVDAYVSAILSNRSSYNYELHSSKYSKANILIIDENDKHEAFVDSLKKANVRFSYHRIGSDHSFSSDRIKVTEIILGWLSEKK